MIYLRRYYDNYHDLSGTCRVSCSVMEYFHGITGLTDEQVGQLRKVYGWNKADPKSESQLNRLLKRAAGEPMLLLLIVTSVVYFFTGAFGEGGFMLGAILLVTLISIYQESRSKNALNALKSITQSKAKVIRNQRIEEIGSEELVPGDIFVIEEGFLVPADGFIDRCNDFSVNESILTGESLAVSKSLNAGNNSVFQGTLVMTGLAVCRATHTGSKTKVGQIGETIARVKEPQSPLEIQISDFVKKMAIGGVVIFVLILAINFANALSLRESLLRALTLAMSILPEEIPVAFATFMALGAWRLMQLGIIVKQTKTVETLGSATVLCVDKTGTLTKNEMSLAAFYVHPAGKTYEIDEQKEASGLIEIAMWASEPAPFDMMEKTLHHSYEKTGNSDLRSEFKMVHEYPLAGIPPMMTHVFASSNGSRIIAAKGAPEAILKVCHLEQPELEKIEEALNTMTGKGFRVLGVADAIHSHDPLPSDQHDFQFSFKGLIGFYDPPKENIPDVLHAFYKAGVAVKIITGDNTATTRTIAKQINFDGPEAVMEGEAVSKLTDEELSNTVRTINIFTRMYPEAKLRVIEALKKNKNIVAMTGDGVNDGPALKAAHIGIAMGKKGSEVAKQSSALILSNDDLEGLVHAIAMGRKIYSNLKKAIQYIISIHIPIILIVFIPLLLNWIYPAVFTPVHVVFFELIMGPTCSIIYENEPIEENVMNEKPRQFSKTFFRMSELAISIVQGVFITAALITIYWIAITSNASLEATTSMIFVTLVTANILLTLVNRSFHYSMIKTPAYENKLIPLIIAITMGLVILIFAIPSLSKFFRFAPLDVSQTITCIAAGMVSVLWFEVYKWIGRTSKHSVSRGTGLLHPTAR
jgi:P-type Ca2+ transporter type 2C